MGSRMGKGLTNMLMVLNIWGDTKTGNAMAGARIPIPMVKNMLANGKMANQMGRAPLHIQMAPCMWGNGRWVKNMARGQWLKTGSVFWQVSGGQVILPETNRLMVAMLFQ